MNWIQTRENVRRKKKLMVDHAVVAEGSGVASITTDKKAAAHLCNRLFL